MSLRARAGGGTGQGDTCMVIGQACCVLAPFSVRPVLLPLLLYAWNRVLSLILAGFDVSDFLSVFLFLFLFLFLFFCLLVCAIFVNDVCFSLYNRWFNILR